MIVEPVAPVDAELQRLFGEQRRCYLAAPSPSLGERRAKLDALERAIRAHREDVIAALAADFSKPREEVEATEILPTLSELKHARSHMAAWSRPLRVATPPTLLGSRSEVRYEPKGIVLILAPWNYPFYLLMTPLIAALAAGNRAIVRSSEKVPHATAAMATIVREAFGAQDVAFAEGGIDVAEQLLRLPFDHIFFTGSTRVGKIVMRAAAEHLAGVTLELGGKSPAFVSADGDVQLAAERIAWGKFMNAGQTCVAPDYVLVHESQERAFVERTIACVEKMYGRSEEDRAHTPDLCRLVNDGAFERLEGLLEATVAEGARVELGGARDRAQRYIAPTILTGVRFTSPMMADEIFGPILPVLTYRSLDEAIAQVNSRPKPLALYAFAAKRTARRIVEGTSAGGTAINDVVVHLANPNLPFGGIGASGVGNYHGHFGFRAFSHERAVLYQGRRSAVALLYPPYRKATRTVLALMDRFF
jgi:aldehyde dehydrogenase (NAD+)